MLDSFVDHPLDQMDIFYTRRLVKPSFHPVVKAFGVDG